MTLRLPGKYAIWFVFVTVLIDMVGFGLVMPVLPALIQELSGRDIGGASLLGGWLFFAYGAMQFLFGPLIGNLSDAFGRRPILLLAVFGLAADYLLTSLAPTMTWLFIGRIIAGVCGASYVTANAYLADITEPKDRARVFGLMGAAFGLGFVIGPALGGFLGAYGTRVPFYAAAVFSLLNFLYGWLVLPETLAPENRRRFDWRRANPLGTLKIFSRHREMIPMVSAMVIYFFGTSVYMAVWSFWGIAKFGWSEAIIGLTLSAFGVITAIAQGLLTGVTVKTFGERGTVIFGLIASAAVLFGYGVATGIGMVMVLVLLHAPEGFVHPTMTAMLSHQVPDDEQGELQGGLASLQSLAMLMGTLIFAELFGYFMQPNPVIVSPSVTFFLAGVLVLIPLAFVVFGTKRDAAATPP